MQSCNLGLPVLPLLFLSVFTLALIEALLLLLPELSPPVTCKHSQFLTPADKGVGLYLHP